MRDVISGMLILHVFHKHNDLVKMANIAQMVNVLQAMILTDGEKNGAYTYISLVQNDERSYGRRKS